MQVLDSEKRIGIGTFFSKTKGLKGTLRANPSDFRVIEVPDAFDKKEDGIFTIARITAENWETNHLIRSLSKMLHISRKRISFAGTKDKRSVSSQYFSFYKVPLDQIKTLSLKDVSVDELFCSDSSLRIGDLTGNFFDIIIRDICPDVDEDQLKACVAPFEKINGFPNFFGVQRFGIIRPITHLVGRCMVEGDFEQAVMIYLTEIFEKEDETSLRVRKELKRTGDVHQAFQQFPAHLRFEKAMLNHLIAHPDDYIGALKQLPKNLLTMFVYAFQSYMFNKVLSKRIENGFPIHQAIEGDIVLPVRNGHISDEEIPVSTRNIDKVNRQLLQHKGYVSAMLLGSDSSFAEGPMGEIEHIVVSDEHIDYRNFIIPELPMASSYGKRRAVFAPLQNLSIKLMDDSMHNGKKAVNVSFQLLKGCYATSFLREIMKADEITNY